MNLATFEMSAPLLDEQTCVTTQQIIVDIQQRLARKLRARKGEEAVIKELTREFEQFVRRNIKDSKYRNLSKVI